MPINERKKGKPKTYGMCAVVVRVICETIGKAKKRKKQHKEQ